MIILWIVIGLLIGTHLTEKDLNKGIDYKLKHMLLTILTSAVFGPLLILFLFNYNKIVLKGKRRKKKK